MSGSLAQVWALVLVAAVAPLPAVAYQNPIGGGAHAKDPSVLVEDGTYYVFTSFTGDAVLAGNVPVQRSTDLVTWEYLGDALPELPAWVDPADAEVRGPATLARPSLGRWLLYFSARHRDDGSPQAGRRCIGVVGSDDPTMLLDGEPSIIPADQPFICGADVGALDPFVYTAPNPNGDPWAWLIWVERQFAQPDVITHTLLTADGTGMVLPPIPIFVAETFFDFWEHGQLANPAMLQNPATGQHYLVYTGNDDFYSVDAPMVVVGPAPGISGINWATCGTGFGIFLNCQRNERRPWVRSQGGAWRPGDAEFVRDGNGDLWMLYNASHRVTFGVHVYQPPTLRLDKVCFAADGKLRSTAPTTSPQSMSRSADCAVDVQLIAEPWPEADALFHQDPRWRGGDGGWSVDLGNGRTLWMFGDSFVDLDGQSRVGSKFIRNSIAIQQGADPSTAQMTFHWKMTADTPPKPTAYFPNSGPNKEVWYWAAGGTVVGSKLVLFQSGNRAGAVDPECPPPTPPPTPAPTPPPPKAVIIPNYQSDADDWNQNWRNIPKNPANGEYCAGEPVVVGNYVYVYVTRRVGCDPVSAALCRYPANQVTQGNFSNAEWWDGQTFSQTNQPATVWSNSAQISVHQRTGGDYLAVMGAPFPGFGRFSIAPAPEGPFAPFQFFYDPPETTWWGDGGGVVTYIYQAHPQLTGAPVVGTYSTHGSAVFFYDDSPYYPKFFRFTPP